MISTPPASDGIGDAVDAAVANAALEGIVVEADEQDLIRRRQRGEITQREFLVRARTLAIDKSARNE